MTITATTSPPAQATRTASVRTARTTGLLYLGLAITGMLGTLVVRNRHRRPRGHLVEPDAARVPGAPWRRP